MQKEEYDVLRLIEHNQVCYVSSECRRGCLLPRWLKYHPHMGKSELFAMIESIVKQLEKIHRCRNNPCYRYVNPYSILRTEDGKVCFLDMNAKDNLEQLRIVQRRTIREHFLPEEEPYYQKESVKLDIYGLGKTIQYLLSETETEPALTRAEERKFQKIISKCLNRHSKKSFQNISEIQKMIPRYKNSKPESGKRKKLFIRFCICIVILGAAFGVHSAAGHKKEQEKEKEISRNEESKETKTKKDAGERRTKEDDLNLELGRVYFLELQDYKKSKEAFESVRNNVLAESMSKVAESILEGRRDDELREALESAERETSVDSVVGQDEQTEYYRCILKGYSYLDSEEDAENVIRIGQICMKQEGLEDKAEIMGYVAAAYEKTGKLIEAGTMYEEQIKNEEDEEGKEELYKKAVTVYEQAEKKEQALLVCRNGIEECPQSDGLRLMYIGILLKDASVDRKVCIQNIKEQLRECPKLKEQEEFQKLLKEHGITVEGDKVWGKESE